VSEESHAQLAWRLVAGTNRGALSTVGLDPPGYPFGSVAIYALDDRRRPVVCMSTLAPHTRNVAADPRASLLVAEPVAEGTDPLDAGRTTLVGDLVPVPDEDRKAVRDLFLVANPTAAGYVDFGDFGFWRLEVRAVRYVGGYGRMSWVNAEEFNVAACS
jgi:heme oxygenase (biliverdin-IX-beta and delta-forming)